MCYYSPEPSTASGSSCFVFVEFNGGSGSAIVMTLSSSFFFFLFCLPPYFPPHRPCAGIFFLSVLFLCVRQQLSFSCYLVRATTVILFMLFCPCNRYLFLFSTYGVPLAIAAFPFLSGLVASHSSEHLSFVSLCFLFFSSSGLLCYVLVPGTLRST